MQITPIGWLLIPTGVLWALIAPRKLYLATLFFAPFSATAVINIGSGDLASGLQVFTFFSFLLIVRELGEALVSSRLALAMVIYRPLLYMSVFVVVCTSSIAMPLWIDGRLQIMSPILIDMTSSPLYFSSANITGVIYLIVGSCSAAIIAHNTIERNEFYLATRVYAISGSFVALWGLFQAVCHVVHIPYPSGIFNTSATPSAQGFGGVLEDSGFRRISSVAVEPSLFAATLLTILPFFIAALAGGGRILGRRIDKWSMAIIVGALIFSTSSTAYLGGLIIVMLFALYLLKFRALKAKHLVLTLGACVTVIAAYLFFPSFQLMIQSALLNKSEGYSALERAKTIYFAFDYFQQYPVLGVGWSSVTSHDTIAKLLSNCGVAGLAAFLVFVGSVVLRLRHRVQELNVHEGVKAFLDPCLILLITFYLTLAVAVVDGFPYVFGHFWVILGLAISATALTQEQRRAFEIDRHV